MPTEWTPGWPPLPLTAPPPRYWVWGDVFGNGKPAMVLVASMPAPQHDYLVVYFVHDPTRRRLQRRPGAYVWHALAVVPDVSTLPWPPPTTNREVDDAC